MAEIFASWQGTDCVGERANGTSNRLIIEDTFTLPFAYPRIKMVNSFRELVTTPFADGVNALCWPRALPGDFGEVVAVPDTAFKEFAIE